MVNGSKVGLILDNVLGDLEVCKKTYRETSNLGNYMKCPLPNSLEFYGFVRACTFVQRACMFGGSAKSGSLVPLSTG